MFNHGDTWVINEMNSTNLKSFEIIGLFGRYNVFLPFDKEVNIYIGENGLGKTTILNCLYYILENKYSQLEDVHFQRIEVAFKNCDKPYSITKADVIAYNQKRSGRRIRIDEYLEYLISELNLSIEDIYNLSDRDLDLLVRKFSAMQGVPPSVARNQLFSYIQSNKKLTSGKHMKGDANKIHLLSKTIADQINERIIYLPTYRRIENDFSNLNIRNDEINNSELLIRFGMSDVQKSIESILNKIRFLAMQGYNEMTSILLKQYAEGNMINYTYDHAIDLDVVKIVLDRLGSQIENKTKRNIIRIIETQAIYDHDYLHLLNLLHKLIANYDLQRRYDNHINDFINTCNKYLNDKYFYYNPSSLTLDIYLGSQKNEDQTVKLTQLSSGEKQIVSLFSKLYLENEDTSIVIIDEPELSLSLKWQQMLLPDIMRSQNCRLLLTVTHSPFIFENEFDNDAKEIRAYMHKR